MMRTLVILPILIPLATAIAAIFARKRRRAQRVISVCGAAALLGAALLLLTAVWRDGILTMQVGDWPAPFGITLAADLFSSLMVVMAGVIGLAVIVYSLESADIRHEEIGYHPLLHILLLGVCGSFITGDLFNLYVWFEVMLIASFVLLGLGGRRGQMEGAIKYVALNLIASSFLLAAIGILYGVAGTLNMADLARYLRVAPHSGLTTVLATLFLVAFGIKSAVFPMFFWLPASYHTPPVAVSAIFAGLLTKVGVYVLIRMFTLLFIQDLDYSHNLILTLSGLTMVTGAFGAVAQNEFRRILSFLIICEIGYLLMGLGLHTQLAIAGTLFFMVHVMLVKSALFLVSGLVIRIYGTCELEKLGGLYHGNPMVAVLFLLPALSLAGIPPLSGFWAKLVLVAAGLNTGQYEIIAVALGVSMLVLYAMMRIWNEAFWKNPPLHHGLTGGAVSAAAGSRLLLLAPTVLLVALTMVIALAAEPLFGLSLRAAGQLLDPAGYIEAVLGKTP